MLGCEIHIYNKRRCTRYGQHSFWEFAHRDGQTNNGSHKKLPLAVLTLYEQLNEWLWPKHLALHITKPKRSLKPSHIITSASEHVLTLNPPTLEAHIAFWVRMHLFCPRVQTCIHASVRAMHVSVLTIITTPPPLLAWICGTTAEASVGLSQTYRCVLRERLHTFCVRACPRVCVYCERVDSVLSASVYVNNN